jgi:hypothetical protein
MAVWRTRGARGFAHFVALRLVQHRRDVVFEAETSSEVPAWEGPGAMLFIDRTNRDHALDKPLERQLSAGEGRPYLDGLAGDDLLFAVTDAGHRIVHHSYVLFHTRTKAVLGESTQTPLFAHCVTAPDARGRHFYPRALRYGLAVLGQRGHRRAVINCDPVNRASIAGIERAGFRRVREIDTWIFASCFGVQKGTTAQGRTFRRLYFG